MEELLNLINQIRLDIDKYKGNSYYVIITQYFKYNIFTYKDDVYLVLEPVMAKIPIDDKATYFKIPKTEKEFNKIFNILLNKPK